MARPKKIELDKEKEVKINLLTSSQAWKTIGGNKRLSKFVEKKYKGTKTLDVWISLFESDNIK